MDVIYNPLKKEKWKKYYWLMPLTVFSHELAHQRISGFEIDLFAYPIFLFFFIVLLFKRKLRPPYGLLIYSGISSLMAILFFNITLDRFIAQYFPIFIIFSTVFSFLNKQNYKQAFEIYFKLGYYTAIFGIIQVLVSYLGVNLMIQSIGRLNSVGAEPSHYAAMIMPAASYAASDWVKYKKELTIIFIALFLTYNLTAYLVFLISLGLMFLNFLSFIFIFIGIYYLIFMVLPFFSENFSERFTDSINLISGNTTIFDSGENINGTSLSFFSNLDVAKYSANQSPIIGSGIGSHEQLYERFYENSYFKNNLLYGLNSKSAHSMTIRILSEMGFLGLGLYIFTLVRNAILGGKYGSMAISIACLSHFLCKTLKLGGYIDFGTPFFFAILIINSNKK